MSGGVDPDVEPVDLRQHVSAEGPVVAAVAVGGVLGAWARYGLGVLLPHAAGAVPWSTVLVNASGCLLIGVLMTFIAGRRDPPRLARPFLVTGVLGGYTTFSTFSVDVIGLARDGHAASAVLYAVLTLAACGLAVWVGSAATARTIGRRR